MVEAEVSTSVNLPAVDIHEIEALCATEKIDKALLLKELVEDGLKDRVIRLYKASKISSGKGAEILGFSLREFMEMQDKRFETSELFDTYCRDCKLSVDISPDIPFSKTQLQKIEKKGQPK